MKKLITFLVLTIVGFTAPAQVPAQQESLVSEPADIVKKFFEAYRHGYHEQLINLLHPQMSWIQPGDNRISGTKQSREEVLKMGKLMGELTDQSILLADVKILSSSGNTVACILQWKAAQPVGNVLDVENIDVYTVENGKIVNVKVYSADLEQENKFWGK